MPKFDVVITHYPAEFKGEAPFASYSTWQLAGGLTSQSRRRRTTVDVVAAEYLEQPGASDVTARMKSRYRGLSRVGGVLPDAAKVIVIPDGAGSRYGLVAVLEPVSRS